MKINWLAEDRINRSDIEKQIKLEYTFRQKATRLLLELIEHKDWMDLSSLEFDFCPQNNTFSISKNTPEPMYSYLNNLPSDFSKINVPWA